MLGDLGEQEAALAVPELRERGQQQGQLGKIGLGEAGRRRRFGTSAHRPLLLTRDPPSL